MTRVDLHAPANLVASGDAQKGTDDGVEIGRMSGAESSTCTPPVSGCQKERMKEVSSDTNSPTCRSGRGVLVAPAGEARPHDMHAERERQMSMERVTPTKARKTDGFRRRCF